MIDRPLYLDRIRPFIGKPVIKIVTGVRRSGKSTLLQLVRAELRSRGVLGTDMLDVNLEVYANRHLKNPDLLYEQVKAWADELDGRKGYLFLDEIQEVETWEQLVPGLQTEFQIDIYLTGSNAHFLSSEFATYLSGRYVEISVFPFSFSEFVRLRMNDGIQETVDEAFDVYRVLGGFPFLSYLDYAPDPCREYLLSIYDTVVLKDMVERESIKDASLLGELLPFLIANIGHTFSGRSIERMLEGENISISVGSVLKYVQVASDANLLYRASRVDVMSKKVFKSQEKYYLVDQGLREAVYGNNDRNIDQVLDNIVFLELLRHGWKVTVGDKPLVVSGTDESASAPGGASREIDFIASKGSRKLYLQVCYLLADESTIEREFKPLEELRSDYPKYVLSLDKVDRSQNGIMHRDIRTFLLESDDLLG
ncbi:ATP-binding protein [Gordonibacter massiliensis (ex Traore et al. 2017)]|uniref:ATP-binding protein n=1 Tax=Gordonibacter massiliensis (ex Traore et al. 2017) TaxID=1841863 RepID=A0A842J8S2_9ACTN|nr:ATP-binding protein [Gordonibacter massiliensis (ex Traore et al. 2017)]MBC2888203.1 ATP-binding protein [Gordonibacter massiliensis (ex Traore et al. 2017)]